MAMNYSDICKIHEFHANFLSCHVLFHEKTHFLIIAGSVFCQKMIKAFNRAAVNCLNHFLQNTLPANIRK